MRPAAAAFDEAKHPRGHGGKFSHSPGGGTNPGGGMVARSITTFKTGATYPPATEIPAGLHRGAAKQCYANAAQAMFDHGLGYAEGYAWSPKIGLWVHHAWNTNPQGQAIDLTLKPDPAARYVGHPFTAQQVAAQAVQRGHYGSMIPNLMPLLTAEDVGQEGTAMAASKPADGPFGVQENHPDCPAGAPHATMHKGTGEVTQCHATPKGAQDMAAQMNIPDAAGPDGGPASIPASAGLGRALPLPVTGAGGLVPDAPAWDALEGSGLDVGGVGHVVQPRLAQDPGLVPALEVDGAGDRLQVTPPDAMLVPASPVPHVVKVPAGRDGAPGSQPQRPVGQAGAVDHSGGLPVPVGVARAGPQVAPGLRVDGEPGEVVDRNGRGGAAGSEQPPVVAFTEPSAQSAADVVPLRGGASHTNNPSTPHAAKDGGGHGNADKLHDYWAHGKGAALIRWNEPGDWQRCVDHVGKYLTDPKGYCAKMHIDVTGMSTSEHAALVKGHKAAADPAPSLPALITIPGVDILAAGTWQLSTGRQTFTRGDLTAAADAAACPAVGPPVIKIGHLDDRFTPDPTHDGEPAIGKVTNLRATPDGNKLVGDMAGMPGWLGAVAASAFPRRSVEGTYNFPCQIGHTHPFVITAVALLGVTPPGVGVLGGLDDIAALYGLPTTAAGGWHTPPADQEGQVMAVTEEDVRRAYYANAGAPPSWWITELQMDPTQLIVADEQTAKVYRVPFQISGAGVEFGSPEEFATYNDVAAARGTGPLVVFASAAESRSVMAQAAFDALTERLARLQRVQAAGAAASTDDAKTLAASLDTLLSQATDMCAGMDRATTDPMMVQMCDMMNAAEAVADQLMEALGIPDPDDPPVAAGPAGVPAGENLADWPVEDQTGDPPDGSVEAGTGHGVFDGKHDHPHSAFGKQGGDATHAHEHGHSNDAVHNHVHAPMSAAPAVREGAIDKMDFTSEQLGAIRAKLGKKDGEEITAADIAAAFAAPTVAASGTPPLPRDGSGMYLVDASILEDYQKHAEAGKAAVRELHLAERDTILTDAVRAGKFPQSRLEHYKLRWASDPDGTRTEVSHLAAGLVPVTGPVGSPGIDPDLPGDSYEDQMAYRKLYPEEIAASKARRAGVREGI